MASLRASRRTLATGTLRTRVTLPRNGIGLALVLESASRVDPASYELALTREECVALVLRIADVFAPRATILTRPGKLGRLEDLIRWLETQKEWSK